MIRFDKLESEFGIIADQWTNAMPFRHVILDDFANTEGLCRLLDELPNPESQVLNKSRDYIFAKNKFEKSGFNSFGELSAELYNDLVSDRFASFLSGLTGREVWIDRDFHGGGLHQGGPGSYLDMHVDFNVHPLHAEWFRDLNVLLYLNRDWRNEYGGQLKLKNAVDATSTEVDPVFNRCVIMETRDYTLHGYDALNFPPGHYRRSIACYAYSRLSGDVKSHSTTWYPEHSGFAKRMLGRSWPKLVAIKSSLIGSRTTKNK